MGLDTYAAHRAPSGEWELAPKQDFAGIALGVGPASNAASNAFQGKIFDSLVTNLTGQTLFEELIPPERVKTMYERLSATPYSEVAEVMERLYPSSPEARWMDFVRFFEICARHSYGLMGSW